MLERWGRFVYRRRWAVLIGSFVLLAGTIVAVLQGGTLSAGGPVKTSLQSGRAADLIATQVSHDKQAGSSFLLIFKSPTMAATDPAFQSAFDSALRPLQGDPRVTSITTPYGGDNPVLAAAFVSKDGHEALALVDLRSSGLQAQTDFANLRSEVRSDSLAVTATGQAPINRAFNTTLESDLQRAERLTLPVTLLLLLIIFGTMVAAGLPLAVGVLTIVGGLAGTLLLSHFTDVSQYALNIVTLIGLGVSIDYSLFVVNRFREELAGGADMERALATTVATAGRAITFSGVTVAVGLSAMLFYQGTFLASMGAAGAIVVAVAVLYGLTFLPALLAILGPRVNRLRVPGFRARSGGGRFWRITANGVMRRPLLVLIPVVGFLVLAGLPFFQIRLANGDVQMLPARLEARQGYDRLLSDFPGQSQTRFDVVVYYPSGSPLTVARIGDQYDLDRRLAAIPGVLKVDSLYDVSPGLTRSDYQTLYYGDRTLAPAVAQLKSATVGRQVVVLEATSNLPPGSDGARNIVKAIRADQGVGDGGQVLVGGQTATDMDVIQFIVQRTPIAVGFVILVTYLVLFLLTGSVVLPLKAVLVNMLSIGASFGALVWIFQQGHLSGLLGFTPQSIDPTIPVILFSIVFGMSMDYEVLLVSRIQEEYLRTGDNRRAVAEGLQRSGRLITGAAAIMVAVFLAFGMADVVIIKAIGIGLAIAVAIDATLVRALIVPAIMRVLGDLNWWAPHPLRQLHRRAGLSEAARGPARKAA